MRFSKFGGNTKTHFAIVKYCRYLFECQEIVGTLMNLQVECLNRGWHGTSWYLWRQGLQHLPTPQISDPSWRTVVFVVMIKVELQLV